MVYFRKSFANQRQENYEKFNKFFESVSYFDELCKVNSNAQELSQEYSFYVAKGGSMGGCDKRIVEIFFGKRPIDQVKVLNLEEEGYPIPYLKSIVERGACLRYERLDNGLVFCSLYPAETENLKQEENMVIIGVFTLNDKYIRRMMRRHFKYLIAYMRCTSTEGVANIWEKILVCYLRYVKKLSIDNKVGNRKCHDTLNWIGKIVLSVGFSGFMLKLVELYFS